MSRKLRSTAIVLGAQLVIAMLALGVMPASADVNTIPERSDPERGTFFHDAADDRYYEVVTYSGGDDRSWAAARAEAASRTIFGGAYRGYLATITSEERNRFVVETIGDVDGTGVAGDGGFVSLWIGAADVGSEGEWTWRTGAAAGQQFWLVTPAEAIAKAGNKTEVWGVPVLGGFAAWVPGEPNNTQGFTFDPEHYAIANYRCEVTHPCTATASWNDGLGDPALGTITSYVTGFLIAYAPAPPNAIGELTLTCTPDPTAVGGVVTCLVTGGPPNTAILWRASLDGTFASAGVTTDAAGVGTFTFVAPAGSDGRSIGIELVEWNASTTVSVVGTVRPTAIQAGTTPRDMPFLLTLVGVGAALVGAVRLVRARS
jgi:hypothetical protein